jgi:hypothetical protein
VVHFIYFAGEATEEITENPKYAGPIKENSGPTAGRSRIERPAAKIYSGNTMGKATYLPSAICFIYSLGGYYFFFLFLPLGNPQVDTTSLEALA